MEVLMISPARLDDTRSLLNCRRLAPVGIPTRLVRVTNVTGRSLARVACALVAYSTFFRAPAIAVQAHCGLNHHDGSAHDAHDFSDTAS
jgi:hypothetical protein